jgi:hypothetical protein
LALKITELKTQIKSWPRTKSGRLILSPEHRSQLVEAFHDSGLGIAQFTDAIGINVGTFYKILNPSRKGAGKKSKAPGHNSLFQPVRVVNAQSSWLVTGPRGLRLECSNVDQLAQLWRSLC